MLRTFLTVTLSLFLISCSGTQTYMREVVKKEGLRLQKKDQMSRANVYANRITNVSPYKVKDKDRIFSGMLGDSDNTVGVDLSNDMYSGTIEIGGGLTKSGNPICVPISNYYNSMVKGQMNEWWYTRYVYCGRAEVTPKVFDDVVVIIWWDEPIHPNHALVATRKHGWFTIVMNME